MKAKSDFIKRKTITLTPKVKPTITFTRKPNPKAPKNWNGYKGLDVA